MLLFGTSSPGNGRLCSVVQANTEQLLFKPAAHDAAALGLNDEVHVACQSSESFGTFGAMLLKFGLCAARTEVAN